MYKESTLKNGLKVLTYEDSSVPVIDVRLFFKAGSRYEEDNQKGYAHILEHMLMKGTTKHPSPVLISQEIDNKGGYSNAFTSRDSLIMLFQAADNYAAEIFELLSDMFFNSLIDSTALENEKKVIIEELNRAKDNTETFFVRFTYEKFFNGHPLESNVLGNSESIMSATTAALLAYKEKFLIPNNSCLAVSGNINHDEVVALAEKYFGGWREKTSAISNVDFNLAETGPHFQVKDLQQTLLSYNMRTVSGLKSREFAALNLVRNFLGFGQSSVLNDELRHKRGLVYSINSINTAFSDTGFFSIRTSTSKPEETIAAIKNVVENLKNIFTENLLTTVKARYVGYYKLNIANPYRRTDSLLEGFRINGRLVTLDEHITEIESISYEEIVHVIDTYLRPENAVVVAMGPNDFTTVGTK